MGYRTYIGTMPKREYNKIKSMTKEQLVEHYKENNDEDGWYKGCWEYGDRLHEFGNTDFNPPKKTMKSFFKNKELKQFYNDDDFFVVNKDFLYYIIELYRNRIKSYYKELLSDSIDDNGLLKRGSELEDFISDKTKMYEILRHVQSMSWEWGGMSSHRPFDLENNDSITNSWKFEYNIFELVRIYKTFDWKKNVMIYYGY